MQPTNKRNNRAKMLLRKHTLHNTQNNNCNDLQNEKRKTKMYRKMHNKERRKITSENMTRKITVLYSFVQLRFNAQTL